MVGIEGSTLGRYELRRRIAQGGMAEVYLAYDRRVRRLVAIKVLYGRDEAFVRRFEREALAVGALTHNHILPLYDFGEQSPWYYLVMPYVEGGTLRDYLNQHHQLTLAEAASILEQIASALHYAHEQGVVHRDVKPSNILLRQDGYAYLVDFGLAKAFSGAVSLTGDGAMVGTPEYMAPEQSNGESDYRSDIYSLGVILYHMLTGRVPFTAESPVAISLKHIQFAPPPPRAFNREITPAVEAVILKAMEKDPNARYQQAREFSHDYWTAIQLEPPAEQEVEAQIEAAESEGDRKQEAAPAAPAAQQNVPAITRVLEETRLAKASLAFKGRQQPTRQPPILPLRVKQQEVVGGIGGTPLSTSLPPAMQKAPRKTYLLGAVMSLLCLLALAIALPLGLFSGKRDHTSRPTPTQGSTATSSSLSDQTATAAAQATLQAMLANSARAQATAGITGPLSAGTVLYADPLTAPGGGWIDDGSQCYFSPQGYHVSTYASRVYAWCYSGSHTFSDAVITAQAQLLRGDTYGIVFRLNPGSRTFYILEINRVGEYRFVRASGDDPLNWLTLIDWTPSTAIQEGYHVTNTFLIVATGSQFRFYINRQLIVATFSDSAYTSGLVGFLVGGDNPAGTEAIFSNIWIFQK
jgi:serine/threonine protein kinase